MCWQCLPLSVVQLKGKHCRKPHCRNFQTCGEIPLHFFELIAFNSKSIATLSQFYVEVQCQWCKGNEKFLFTFFPTEQPLPIVKTTSLEQDGDHPLTSLDFCDISIKPIVFSTKIFNRVDHSINITTVSSQRLLSTLRWVING